MPLRETPLIGQDALRLRIETLAREISRDYAGSVPLVLGVLKGALHVTSDLARAMDSPLELGFIHAKSYEGTDSSGDVRLSGADPGHIRHRDVLVVEDILDTGRTLHAVVGELEAMGANSIRVCALLDKPGRRIVPFEAQYRGFEIANEFVVGYGLDYNERYRELPAIHIFDPDA